MPARLIESLATTEPLAELFSDISVLQAMLDFEVALARTEARLGIVPQAAADHIATSAQSGDFNISRLVQSALRAGTASIPLVGALTEKVREKNAEAAGYVHWGATSQDVADTALVLLLKRAQPILLDDLERTEKALFELAKKHKETVMLGRTLLQAATPITFGLKAAGWLGELRRSGAHLKAAFAEALLLQFGGASGTLASLGDKGARVADALAKELGLQSSDAPWHTHRDRLANLVCACGVLTGSLGKMAKDVSLLMQNEIAEVAEPGGEGRGGSSTMPHKRNPTACALALSAAYRTPGLVATFLTTMVQEHERAVGGWHAEWPVIASVIQATGLAAASMAEVAEGLSVDAARMRENIENTNGIIFAERAMMLLGARLGRDAAHKLLEEATRQSVAQKKHLAEVLAEMPEVASQIDRTTLQQLEVPGQYLGSAERFRKALLSSNSRSRRK